MPMTRFRNPLIASANTVADINTASGTLVDMAGLSITFNKGVRPVKIVFDCPFISNNDATGGANVNILRGSTVVKTAFMTNVDAVNAGGTMHFEWIDTSAAGAYTFKMQWARVTAGTISLSGSLCGPTYIYAERL